MFVSCNERTWYQDFSLRIDFYEFTVRKEDYIMSVNDVLGEEASAEFDDVCMLSIIDARKSDYWVLG